MAKTTTKLAGEYPKNGQFIPKIRKWDIEFIPFFVGMSQKIRTSVLKMTILTIKKG